MTCKACQRLLLGSEDPSAPDAKAQAHLAECLACSRWHRRLLRIERNIPLLPTPPARGKKRLLNQLLQTEDRGSRIEDRGSRIEDRGSRIEDRGSRIEEETANAAGARRPQLDPRPSTLDPRSSIPFWRRPVVVRLGGAVAAGVLIACGVLLGLSLMRGRTPEVPVALVNQDVVARLADCDVRLAEADTPRKRVEALADMADALRHEGHALRRADDSGDELREVARLYEQVVRDGVVSRARGLPAAERRQVLNPIVTRLARAEREARALAGDEAEEPMLQIAEAARAADRDLRELMEEVR